MSNIIDYMKWRGDLTFAQDSFNEIDNLILSQLVYVELNNIVPGDEEPTISLLDAAKLFFKQNNEQELLDHVSMTKNAIDRKSTRLNSSHTDISRMPSSA